MLANRRDAYLSYVNKRRQISIGDPVDGPEDVAKPASNVSEPIAVYGQKTQYSQMGASRR